jgi:hypothetical protein
VQNNYKLQKYYLTRTPHKNTKSTPIEHSIEHHKDTKSSSKASLLLLKRVAAIWQQYYKRENGERARESEEKIGQHGVAMKLDVKNEERGLSFKGGREERPPLHALQVSLPKEGGSLKGGGTMREGNSH